MKQAFRHKPAAPKVPKKALKHAAQAVKPKKVERKHTAPIFNTSLAGSVLKYIRPFDSVWPSEPEEGLEQNKQKKKSNGVDKKNRFKAPIFNGPLEGTNSNYVRPFDPVWPV